jgi:hypothetical protein
VSLLIAPVASGLAQKFNAVLGIRRRTDTLALGNITGAMVLQSTFPVSVGLLFTTRQLDTAGPVSGVLALISGTVFHLTLRIKHTLTGWSSGGAGSVYFACLIYEFGFAPEPARGARRPRSPRALASHGSYLAMIRSTVVPLATSVPASGTILTTVPGG